jgi:Ca2+:H+ antiporter
VGLPAEPETTSTRLKSLTQEVALLALVATALVFGLAGDAWLLDLSHRMRALLLFVWLFGVIVWGSMGVVRHAEHLAERMGEPYGTLLLTLSVSSIEILTLRMVMITGESNPVLARDAMFAVLMIVLNGLIGLALLLGGLRYREQAYNLRGVNAYLSVITALAMFGLIVPNFTDSTPSPTFSVQQEVFLVVMCLGLYAVFLAVQTTRHRAYFLDDNDEAEELEAPPKRPARPVYWHIALLVAYLTLVMFLAHRLALLLNHGLETYAAPSALGGLLLALLVLTPEGIGGIRAALENRMQRAVNILLGSALTTLALTIPAVLLIGMTHDTRVVLGLQGVEQPLLVLTLLLSTLTFASGRSTVLQGAVHLMLFGAYLMLIVWR